MTETVRIGVAKARVTSVTQERIAYLDAAGNEGFVDLEQCARNWVKHHNDHETDFVLLPGASTASAETWNARCVGERGGSWVEFMSDPRMRLEFESWEEMIAELLGPLRSAGWHTFDTN